ncbi:hypothetical protein A3752_17990, partial [Oleiphilus sp. HI0081]
LILVIRAWLYRLGFKTSYRSSLPIIVVGNITLGGTGKSPLVAYLVQALQERGYQPGIVSRGYGASIPSTECREVLADSLPEEVGDEPLMLKQALDCPVFVSPNRKLSVQALEAQGCNVVISDDGLQHNALQRDVEVCVYDGQRALGNGYLLPMGPLRESQSRMKKLDFQVINGADDLPGVNSSEPYIRMDLRPGNLLPLKADPGQDGLNQALALEKLSGQPVNAVAAIGNPERFFEVLERSGMIVMRHAFEDHHAYSIDDFGFSETLPIIMTEKDAVKCRSLGLSDAWYLPVEAELSANLADLIIEKIEGNSRG